RYTGRRFSVMSRLSIAVVVDDDPRDLKAVAFGFEREGVRVEVASAVAEEAAQKVASCKAELLVISVEGVTACDLTKAVRAHKEEVGKTAILVIGPKAMRKSAMLAGASEDAVRDRKSTRLNSRH